MNIEEYWKKKNENSHYLEYLRSFEKQELKNLIREITRFFSEDNQLGHNEFKFTLKDSIKYVAIAVVSYYEYEKFNQNQLINYITNMLNQYVRGENSMMDIYFEAIIGRTNIISLDDWYKSCKYIDEVHSEWIELENYTDMYSEKTTDYSNWNDEENYNNEQLSLINELENNILLIASAGTGKTDSLSKRIANIIEKEYAAPNEILCITFTNKACVEMKNRIEEIVGKEAKNIYVKTFHSFCLQIIKEYAKSHTDIFTDFTILDEYDCKEILKKFSYNSFPLDSIYRFISLIKEKRIHLDYFSDNQVEDYKKIIEYLFRSELDSIHNICTYNKSFNKELESFFKFQGYALVNQFNNELKNNHMVDFTDLIIEAKRIFEDENVVESYRNRYKYINVDEVQDTSVTEYKIIEKLFKGNSVLLCGDKFQTIYQWRGSNANTILKEFRKYSPKVIKFYKNYRATKNLTNASLNYLESTFYSEYESTYDKAIEAHSKIEGEKIQLKCNFDRSEEARWINNKISDIFANNLNSEMKVCVLTRDNYLNVELSRNLNHCNNNSYEYMLVDQYKFFRREEIKDIISFFKIIVNINDTVSLKRILLRFPTNVGESTIRNIESKEYKEAGIKLTDFFNDSYGEYFYSLIEAYNSNHPMVIFDVESTGIDVTEDEIIQIAAIKIDKNGDIIEAFERFIKPSKSLGNSVFVHGFTDEYLNKNGENKKDVLRDFIKFSKDALIVGHNVQYDISILTSELQRLKMDKPIFNQVYDTLDIYRRFYPNLINHKLETLSKLFDIKHKPSHNAFDDVNATGALLILAIKEKIIPTSMKRFKLMNININKFREISLKINKLIEKSISLRPHEILDYILENFSFESVYLISEREDKSNRIKEFRNFLDEFDNGDKNNEDALVEVVNLTALSNGELEELMLEKTGKVKIPIITVHQAKGLEFDYVFLAGLEEGKFPSYRSVQSGDLEEEKRLFYVAITRAKKRLYLSYCKNNAWGYSVNRSRFIDSIEEKYLI